jgi:hypothetical protein
LHEGSAAAAAVESDHSIEDQPPVHGLTPNKPKKNSGKQQYRAVLRDSEGRCFAMFS